MTSPRSTKLARGAQPPLKAYSQDLMQPVFTLPKSPPEDAYRQRTLDEALDGFTAHAVARL